MNPGQFALQVIALTTALVEKYIKNNLTFLQSVIATLAVMQPIKRFSQNKKCDKWRQAQKSIKN